MVNRPPPSIPSSECEPLTKRDSSADQGFLFGAWRTFWCTNRPRERTDDSPFPAVGGFPCAFSQFIATPTGSRFGFRRPMSCLTCRHDRGYDTTTEEDRSSNQPAKRTPLQIEPSKMLRPLLGARSGYRRTSVSAATPGTRLPGALANGSERLRGSPACPSGAGAWNSGSSIRRATTWTGASR